MLQNTSRRSFIKKTTVLAVGVSTSALFTGLVNASTGGGYAYTCVLQKVPVYEDGVISYHKCYFEGAADGCSGENTVCGLEMNPGLFGVTAYAVVFCGLNKTEATAVKCKRISTDTPV